MKKNVCVLLVILVFGLLLSGCGAKEDELDAKNPTAIMVWHYYSGQQKEVFEQLVQTFNETVGVQKGIIVTAESKGEVITLSESVRDAAAKAMGAEAMPDVFAAYMDSASVLAEMGALADISQYMTEEELAAYVPSFLEEGRLNGEELWALPVAKSTELLYLNKTDWDKFAQDTGHELSELNTWESMAAIAGEYYEWSGGKAFFGRDATANFMYVGCHQLGSDITQVTEEGSLVQLDLKALQKIWDAYGEPYIRGYYGAYGRFRSDDVKTGDLIACVASTSSVAYFPSEVTLEDGSTYPIESIALPLPNFEGTAASSVQQGAGMAVAKSDAKREQAAVEFLKWFTAEEQNILFCVDSGYFPVKAGDSLKQNMEAVLQENGIAETELIYQNVILGLSAFQETELYAPKIIENSENYRVVFTKHLTERLDVYKEQYGNIEPSAQEEYLEQCFEEWARSLNKAVQN